MNKPVHMSEFRTGQQSSPPTKPPIRFVESGAFSCKFILGAPDANAVCCGAPTDGRSWCDYHRGVVFDFSRVGRIR